MAMSPIPPMLVELQLETAKIQAQLQQMNGRFDEFGKTVEKQTGPLTRLKTTMLGVFGGNVATQGLFMLKNAIGDAVKDAQEYEVILAKTAAVIKSTGNVAGISVQGIKGMANSLEELSGIDENLIINGQNVLATFTNVRNAAGAGNDIFNQATAAALDLSVALGTDLQGANIQLGKALNDPIKGINALRRVGVSFTAEQIDMVKGMVNAGDVMGAQKLILKELNTEFGGAAKASGDTFAGAVERAKDKVQDFARDLITNLQPILLAIGKTIGDFYNKYLAPMFSWINKNKEAVLLFVGIIGTAVVAFKIYKGVMIATAAAQELYVVAMALMRGAKLADIAATEGQTGAMVLLNAVMNANPIALVVTAIAALAAGFVIAWNHSKTFRVAVVEAMKGVVMAVGYVIKIFGVLVQAITNVATGPLQLLLKGLALLKVPGAKQALEELRKPINAVGEFFDKAGNAVQDYADKLDALKNKKIKLPSFGGKTTPDGTEGGGGTPPGGGLTADQIKAMKAAEKQRVKDIAAANKEVAGIYDDMNKAIADGQKKADDAYKKLQKDNLDSYDSYNKAKEKLDAKYEDNKQKLKDKYAAADKKATAAYDAEVLANNKRFNDTKNKLIADAADREKAIRAKYAEDVNTLERNAAEKRVGIIQKSIDQLRGAFASGLSFSFADAFKENSTAGGIAGALKKQLTGALALQKNAAALAGKGYSQTFIQEIVKNGPEVGNQMAEAILSADSDTQKSLRDLYSGLENITESGMDALGATMNSSAKLATKALMDEYNQVGVDLAVSLAAANEGLNTSLAKSVTDYEAAVADATATRDAANADSYAKLQENLKQSAQDLADALVELKDTYNSDLAELGKELQDALAENQKNYEDAIAKIVEDTKAKLDELMVKLGEAAQKLKDLGAASAAAAAIANAPSTVYVPPVAVGGAAGSGNTTTSPYVAGKLGYEGMTQAEVNAELARERGNKLSVVVNANTNADPKQIGAEVGYVISTNSDATYSIPKGIMTVGAYDK